MAPQGRPPPAQRRHHNRSTYNDDLANDNGSRPNYDGTNVNNNTQVSTRCYTYPITSPFPITSPWTWLERCEALFLSLPGEGRSVQALLHMAAIRDDISHMLAFSPKSFSLRSRHSIRRAEARDSRVQSWHVQN